MKILMLGWEFPPFFAGGVGTICYELTRALMKYKKVDEIIYIMPFGPDNIQGEKSKHIKLLVADNEIGDREIKLRIESVSTLFRAYMTPEEYMEAYTKYSTEKDKTKKELYGANLYLEVERFALKVAQIAEREDFDIIHAHDWMTGLAGVLAKEVSGKPLIFHVHNTIYDRYLGMGGEHEKAIETKACMAADRVIAVSNLTKDYLVNKYGIDSDKIEVVHNGAATSDMTFSERGYDYQKKDEKVVLFTGRLTLQKGIPYFLQAAKKVIDIEPNTRFILAGDGEMLEDMKNLAQDLGIYNQVTFWGRYTRDEAENALFANADVYVMPSVSEPFGLTAIEPILKSVPVIVSKQTGVSEVLDHCLKVDFWDTEKMAEYILALLKYGPLYSHMSSSAVEELPKFKWDGIIDKVVNIYDSVKR